MPIPKNHCSFFSQSFMKIYQSCETFEEEKFAFYFANGRF